MSDARGMLVVGAGGLSSPVLQVLAKSGVKHITLVDDDCVEESNLHRQTLYSHEDVGSPKIEVAARVLAGISRDLNVRLVSGRFVPSSAMELLSGHSMVIEGADNLATKFLVADAAALAGVPAIQAGAVRWSGWAWCSVPGSACLRCVFEDIPRDRVETCAEAGVIGPVVGVLGGIQAALALRVARGDAPGGQLWHYEGLAGALRKTFVRRRTDCPLCAGKIKDLRVERYAAPCAA